MHFIYKKIDLFILGIAFILSIMTLFITFSFGSDQLNAFGPTALIYLNGIKTGLVTSTIILFLSFVGLLFFKTQIEKLFIKTKNWFEHLTKTKRNLIILGLCIIFTFAVHGNNVINGYFNMDDFEIMTITHTSPFVESLFIPHGNDHMMPLYMAEMKILDIFFGQNPLPYNLFVFLLFALIPFFIYLIFQRLNIGLPSFFVFLILFSGATGWADMLSGFIIMSIYMQMIFFFSVALWSYLAWSQTYKNKYLIYFGLATLFAITIDLPGIWVLPLIPLWMFFIHWIKQNDFKIDLLGFIKTNKKPLLIILGVIIIFTILFFITFVILKPNTFLSTLNADAVPVENEKSINWRPLPLTKNFLSLFASGVSLTAFAPNIVRFLSHPVLFNKAVKIWPYLEILIILVNLFIFWLFFKYAKNREKKFALFLLSIILVTLAIVVVARPNHSVIAVDFDYRYAGPAFYAYILLFSIGVYTFINKNREFALKIIIPVVIILFSAQQVFSFQATRLREESKLRKIAVSEFEKSLLIELDTLGKDNPSLIIPNLSGEHILKIMPGFTLADYVLFFNNESPVQLIQNIYMPPDVKTGIVETVSSIRASTSPAFKEALKTYPYIKEYYSSPILLRFKTLEQKNSLSHSVVIDENREILIKKDSFDPEKFNTLGFSLYTDNINGNLELLLTFNNEFNDKEETQRIRIDDFTQYSPEDNTRVHHIELNLLQIHTYSLSDTVSNLKIYVPETKNAIIKDLYFE